MKSAASIKGHPIHPMLVSFPIGLFGGSLACDAIGLLTGSKKLQQTGYHLMLGGLIGGAAAAIPGLIDYLTVIPPKSQAESTGKKHALANIALMGVFGANALLRAQGGSMAVSVAMSTAGCGLMVYSGWLGGDLVYQNQIAVDHYNAEGSEHLSLPSIEGLSGSFVPVCGRGDLKTGQLALIKVNGVRIALAKLDEDRFAAFSESCTHMGGPLSDGTLIGEKVMCPWHGSEFNVCSGAVECGPADKPVQTYEVRVDGERVQIKAPAPQEHTLIEAGSLG